VEQGSTPVCVCNAGYEKTSDGSACVLSGSGNSSVCDTVPCYPGTTTPIEPEVCSFDIWPPNVNKFKSFKRDGLCDKPNWDEVTKNLHHFVALNEGNFFIDTFADMAGVGVITFRVTAPKPAGTSTYLFMPTPDNPNVFVGQIKGTSSTATDAQCGLALAATSASTIQDGRVTLVLEPGTYTMRAEAFESDECNKYPPNLPFSCGANFDPAASVVETRTWSVTVYPGVCQYDVVYP
jgi:hypothetical protein